QETGEVLALLADADDEGGRRGQVLWAHDAGGVGYRFVVEPDATLLDEAARLAVALGRPDAGHQVQEPDPGLEFRAGQLEGGRLLEGHRQDLVAQLRDRGVTEQHRSGLFGGPEALFAMDDERRLRGQPPLAYPGSWVVGVG